MAIRFSSALPRGLRYEPTPKRVRASLGAATVADTTRAVLVWEPERVVPAYAIPAGDVDASFLRPDADPRAAQHTAPLAVAFSLVPGDGSAPRVHAAWRYDDDDLAGFVVLDFQALDAWLEEDEPVVAHPRDPFHRVDARRSTRHVRVGLDGRLLADSRRPVLVFETGLPVRHYLPREDVDCDALEPSGKRTACAYKGIASYFSLAGAEGAGRDIAWSYPDPLPDNPVLRDLVCFHGERVDITADGARLERPRTQWS